MDVTIRKAELRDHASVVRIMRQVQQMHADRRPDLYRPNEQMIPREVFAQFIADDCFYVADDGGTVVGILALAFRHVDSPYHVRRDIVYVDSLAVAESRRGQGIGHMLLDKAREIKAEKRYDSIELTVNAWNRDARELYARYGFKEKSIDMELN